MLDINFYNRSKQNYVYLFREDQRDKLLLFDRLLTYMRTVNLICCRELQYTTRRFVYVFV